MLSTAAGIRTIDPQFIAGGAQHGGDVAAADHPRDHSASVPTVFTGLRGGALTIIGAVVSEMLTSAAGIGYLVTLNRTILDSPRVFAAILDDRCWRSPTECWRGQSSGALWSGNPPTPAGGTARDDAAAVPAPAAA